MGVMRALIAIVMCHARDLGQRAAQRTRWKISEQHEIQDSKLKWNQSNPTGHVIIVVAFSLAVALAGYALPSRTATARDVDGRYANSPLKSWFESLHSGKGPCCSDADGTALSDVDWQAKDGHYLVRIEGRWWDVPDEAVIDEPNRAGRTMVWPVYYRAVSTLVRVEIRCFIPGSMI
jgi:hypothetical protein